jgi:hypothetical protein
MPPASQPKLVVGQADDPLEHEADRVAALVMRMPDPHLSIAASTPRLSHKCASYEEEAQIFQSEPTRSPEATGEAPRIVHEVLRSPGQPLDAQVRAFFEPRFGVDFGDVRLHTDARAADTALALGALAYTVGKHIVLGPAQIPLRVGAGWALLAHELAHVVQQSRATRAPTTRANALAMQRVGAPLVQRATKKGCIAPSFVVTPGIASVFGTVIAEPLVDADYLAIMGGTPFADVFFDNPLGPMSYVAFLVSHHPSLNPLLLAGQISLAGGVLVPDILDTRTLDFYDVKPDSPDGRFLGRGKLAAIDAFMAFNALPYGRGVFYTPTPSLPIPLGGPALVQSISAIVGPLAVAPALACGFPVVTLAPKRAASGLLLYQVCVEADLDCYLKVLALEALIAAIIIAVILTQGGLLPELEPALGPALTPAL